MNTPVTTTSVWSPRDEAALNELIERKDRIMRASRQPLVELMRSSPADSSDSPHLVEWLIDNAQGMRDVLAPFDGRAEK